ncbi:hypothetical protein ACFOGJ_08965 [Marinibaculum pumilum]|uniref:Uncharacterized protein n=1 Tax=Marinibaculum pumilum TaxID=1766165 RepID=A0ABV7KYF0_9PROT
MARKAKDEAARVLPDLSEIRTTLKGVATAYSKLETAKAQYRNALKGAKGIGLETSAITMMLKADPQRLLSDLETMRLAAEYAGHVGRHDVAKAGDLFAEAESRMRDLVEAPLLADGEETDDDDDDFEEDPPREPAAAKPGTKPATKHKGDGATMAEIKAATEAAGMTVQ